MTEKKAALPPDWSPSAKVEITIREVAVELGEQIKLAAAKRPEPKSKDDLFYLIEKCLLVRRRLDELATSAEPQEPPKVAEVLLILCSGSGKRAEAIQGDLCEQFTLDCAEMSVARARRRYWSRVLASLGPQIRRTIARAVRWVAIISLVKKIIFMAG